MKKATTTTITDKRQNPLACWNISTWNSFTASAITTVTGRARVPPLSNTLQISGDYIEHGGRDLFQPHFGNETGQWVRSSCFKTAALPDSRRDFPVLYLGRAVKRQLRTSSDDVHLIACTRPFPDLFLSLFMLLAVKTWNNNPHLQQQIVQIFPQVFFARLICRHWHQHYLSYISVVLYASAVQNIPVRFDMMNLFIDKRYAIM